MDRDNQARREKATGDRYTSTINNNEALTRQINDLFKIEKDGGTLQRKMFAAGEEAGFATEAEWRQAAKWNDLAR